MSDRRSEVKPGGGGDDPAVGRSSALRATSRHRTSSGPSDGREDFIETLPRFAYFPFGGGPRTCIGSAFSHIESSIVLAAFVRRFVLEAPSDIEARPYLGVTLLPEGNSIELRLKERKRRLMASAAAATPGPRRPEGRCPLTARTEAGQEHLRLPSSLSRSPRPPPADPEKDFSVSVVRIRPAFNVPS